MENNRFEDSFKEAFSGAEISPSAGVWTNIELSLEKASGGRMKRNLLLFQLLAAASVVFACGLSAVYYLNQPSDQHDNQLALNPPAVTSPAVAIKDDANDQTSANEKRSTPETNTKEIAKAHVVRQTPESKSKNNHISDDKGIAALPAEEFEGVSPRAYHITRTELSSFVKTKKPVLVLQVPEAPVEADPGMLLLARLKDEERKYLEEDKKKKRSEKMWASFGIGAGNYKPNRQVSDNGASSGSVNGESYSMALQVASKVSRRIIVQGGISYLTQNADFTSASSNGSMASFREYNKSNSLHALDPGGMLNGGGTNSYQVNSSLQFISIPVQAGYLIVDRAFGIQLNGGISTDLFISNTLTPETGDYQKVTQAAGKDSPYRTVNFSGLAGTEFSYKIADQYRISINPGLRYSLNSIYKQGVAAEITPVTFDVSLRFRYIFK